MPVARVKDQDLVAETREVRARGQEELIVAVGGHAEKVTHLVCITIFRSGSDVDNIVLRVMGVYIAAESDGVDEGARSWGSAGWGREVLTPFQGTR